jgi:ribosomal protein S18 acetylase RimI-like enzyme
MPQSPVKECQSAASIEPAGLIAWPARESIDLDGWVLRFTDGFTHRANSVATLEFRGGDVEGAIARVEREYRDRGLAPMFQIASLVAPVSLAGLLIRREYRMVSPSLVLVTTPARVLECIPEPGEVACDARASDGFAGLVLRGSTSPDDGRERLDILSSIAAPVVCVTAYDRGALVACGMGVNVAGQVGINLMRTDAAHRRHGHARRVLSAIAQWAAQQRAPTLYLSVDKENLPAVALYKRAGFSRAYSYRYYAKGRHS